MKDSEIAGWRGGGGGWGQGSVEVLVEDQNRPE